MISRSEQLLDAVRRSRLTFYIVAAVYVMIGFGVAVPAAINGDRLSTFLGFLIISGALGGAAIVGNLVRLSLHLSALGRSLDHLREQLVRLQGRLGNPAPADPGSATVQVMDLATVGTGDPSPLVAATLERDRYPRLVDLLDQVPATGSPASPASADRRIIDLPPAAGDKEAASGPQEPPAPAGVPGVTVKNLFRRWQEGLRNHDLVSCREAFAALVDTADPRTVAAFRDQLDELGRQKERTLRMTFRDYLLRRDLVGMLEVGERICRELPDRPIALEFRRLKGPLMQRCLKEIGIPSEHREAAGDSPAPPLRVVY